MTVHSTEKSTRARFGGLTVAPSLSPEEKAIQAIGHAVPALEEALGFSISVTAEAKPDGFIWLEVILPDEHYTGQTRAHVRQVLREAAHPFSALVLEIDSAAPYA